jgi:hypothetical protein
VLSHHPPTQIWFFLANMKNSYLGPGSTVFRGYVAPPFPRTCLLAPKRLILRRYSRSFAFPRTGSTSPAITVPNIPDRLPPLWPQYLYRRELERPSGYGSEWPHAPSISGASRLAWCPHRGSDVRGVKMLTGKYCNGPMFLMQSSSAAYPSCDSPQSA